MNIDFVNSTDRSKSYEAKIRNYKVDFGLQFIANLTKKQKLILGATYSLGHSLNAEASVTEATAGATNTTSITNGFHLPHSYGAGFVYSYNDQWSIGADYTFQQWSSSTFFGKENGVGVDRSRISVGAAYSPNQPSRNLFKMMSYRAGAYYAQPYTKINGLEGCDEYGVSAGVSIPFYNNNNSYSHATLHISGQFVHLAPRSAGLITENYLRINIGITFNESWFMKLRVR